MPLPHFLALIIAVILAAGATLWFAAHAGLPLPLLGLGLLAGAGLVRLMARVE
ncbi:hypothetical protein [Phaeovulum sp. W22_SRMD_FR3]|uniref:hypothetical protein n=1 Tax=Phaeovulum sp. W22_SRMD_FR3 TaxID=3240274 RepID=UPI003F96D056